MALYARTWPNPIYINTAGIAFILFATNGVMLLLGKTQDISFILLALQLAVKTVRCGLQIDSCGIAGVKKIMLLHTSILWHYSAGIATIILIVLVWQALI